MDRRSPASKDRQVTATTGVSTHPTPLTTRERLANYAKQTRLSTPAQERRMRHKHGRALARARANA